MGTELRTKRGHDFYVVSSALQKAIRRNLPRLAGYFALELFMSGFQLYVWKRLLTISAEDCAGLITKEVKALYDSWELLNKGNKANDRCRVMMSKAVLLLCAAQKNRDADHLGVLVYDRHAISDETVTEFLATMPAHMDVPQCAYDVHTRHGRMAGKTREDFLREELNALEPRQAGLFDSLVQ